MRHRSFIAVLAVLLLLVGGGVGLYAYDSGRDDLIAEGVTAGGIEIGGMREEQARRVLADGLGDPLTRPIVVRAGRRSFRLSAERARLAVDTAAMIDTAVRHSREGNLLSRAWRDVRGDRLYLDVPARVSHSKDAVAGLVRRVRRGVERPARDARVAYTGTGLDRVAGQNGQALRAKALERRIVAELAAPNGSRLFRARLKRTQPDVTVDELADKYPYFVTVSRQAKELRFYRQLKLVKKYRIAVGRVGFETPAGLYHIQSKAVDVAWSVPEWGGDLAGKVIPGGDPRNPLKARWLGIYDGAGIHGTDDVASLGSSASHGCIRMAIPEVKELYERVPVQTPIFIS